MAPEDAGVQEQPQEPLVRTDHRGIDSPAGAATNAGQREDLQAYLEGLDEFMAGRSELMRKKNSTTHFLLEGHLVCDMPKAHIATFIG